MKKHEWYRDTLTGIRFMYLEPAGSKRKTVRVYDEQAGVIREVNRLQWELDVANKRLIKSKGGKHD